MYRHLLVPIENSDLSTVTIGRAVEFALALGARITFFHASADHSASISGDADRLPGSRQVYASYWSSCASASACAGTRTNGIVLPKWM